MSQIEKEWDDILQIKTTGRDDSRSNQLYFPYEPTDYVVLNRIATYGYIRKKDVLLDYGAGKGRVSFLLAYQTGCRTIGIEYDERLIYRAEKNKKKALSGGKTSFILANASDFEVPEEVTCCFFFNPFSTEILGDVMERVVASYRQAPRDIMFFFYYPSKDYEEFLVNYENIELVECIDCQDLFEDKNDREKVLIYKMS